MKLNIGILLVLCVLNPVSYGAPADEPLSAITVEQRGPLAKRLEAYVKANREHEWDKLYDLVSDNGRGGVTRQVFVVKMKGAHGKDFANEPDLVEFKAGRSEKNEHGGYDIYGCGSGQREDMLFKGIAVVHAVYEHSDWFFTGWRFTEFPNEPCKKLADPAWGPQIRLLWNQPMEELRGLPADIKPKR
jgi:hypothetical protein